MGFLDGFWVSIGALLGAFVFDLLFILFVFCLILFGFYLFVMWRQFSRVARMWIESFFTKDKKE